MRYRNLVEANFSRHSGKLLLVGRITVAVHQYDCDGAQAALVSCKHVDACFGQINRPDNLAVGRHTFVDLNDVPIEQLRQHNLTFEQLGPILISNPQRIPKASSGD